MLIFGQTISWIYIVRHGEVGGVRSGGGGGAAIEGVFPCNVIP